METEPLLTSPPSDRPNYGYPDPNDDAVPDQLGQRSQLGQPSPGQQPPPDGPPEASRGLRPTDPTRSGALWVGGAGVALLLAAAAVLTAVRWDEIGQSAKLGGLALITAALLGAGQRFKDAIPMTSQALFHLGALLIPFDMAAVATLAGRSWQETLLLTAVTSVVALYGIERAVPSVVLRVGAGIGVVGLAAGVAALTSLAMPLLLAIAAMIAVALRKPTEAGLWALLAGVLPIAGFVDWPSRIAGAMDDLGFDSMDRIQPLIAGVLSTLVLVAVTRVVARVEIAWSAIATGLVTLLVNFGSLGDLRGSVVTTAAVILGLELAAIAAQRDPLWKPITRLITAVAEVIAAAITVVLFLAGTQTAPITNLESSTAYGVAAALLALAWLVADRRRLDDHVDWLAALAVGSDWVVTTLMFPAAVLGATLLLGAPLVAASAMALALAFWMVATWRSGSAYGALALAALGAVYGAPSGPWVELAIGGGGAAVLSYAARQRIRANDSVAAVVASVSSVFIWLVAAGSLVLDQASDWPYLLMVVGAWGTSWALDVRTSQAACVEHYVGRASALLLLATSPWFDAQVGLAMSAAVMAMAGIDYVRSARRASATTDTAPATYAVIAGAALGISAAPIATLAGLAPATAGAALAVAGFVLVGLALVGPQKAELPLASAAVTASATGLVLAFAQASMFAVALVAVGASIMFAAAALRDLALGVVGYIVCGIGVSLQLAVWGVAWLEPYLILPAVAAFAVGHHFHRSGVTSWATYAPTIAVLAYVSIAERWVGGPAWHSVIAGGIGVLAVIAGGYRKLVGPLVTGTVVLAIVVGLESLGPAALVPTWAWLAAGGVVLLSAGVALERSDTTPLERGQQIRAVVADQFS